ncbi:hypothetical protein [uncultured Roseobacter sp.]|uniref:hypothetical protein n=1 Tax=uncultured Roseobacter sp. TaxID=114847 RepID=UPI0026041770|nr:hypothetical protein [uncultured Roseobacter sp.]
MGKVDKRRFARLEADVRGALAFDYPNLSFERKEYGIEITGTFSVTPLVEEYQAHGAIASFDIRIEVPWLYPKAEPKVFELGNAFPQNADFHCNPKGDCCICVFESWRATAQDTSLGAYLNGPIRNFFLSQFIRQETGVWPFDEWKHGRAGYIDACAERLGCKNSFEEVDYLLRVLSHDWPRGHWECPCKSGKKIKACCAMRLKELSIRVEKHEARSMRKRLGELGT